MTNLSATDTNHETRQFFKELQKSYFKDSANSNDPKKMLFWEELEECVAAQDTRPRESSNRPMDRVLDATLDALRELRINKNFTSDDYTQFFTEMGELVPRFFKEYQEERLTREPDTLGFKTEMLSINQAEIGAIDIPTTQIEIPHNLDAIVDPLRDLGETRR